MLESIVKSSYLTARLPSAADISANVDVDTGKQDFKEIFVS